MAHEIFGERFLGHREPAWHGLGTVFTEPIGALEAFEMAGLNYEVEKFPVVGIRSVGDSMEPMETGKYGLFRQPTADAPEWHFTGGIVGDGFTVVQNMHLAEMIEPFTKEWPVETVAAMREGAITLVTLDVGMFEIAGERYRQYLSCVNGHDGSRALGIHQSAVREVCMNTVVQGEKCASLHIKLRHTEGVVAEAAWYTEQILAIRSGFKRQAEVMQRMADVKLKTAGFKNYVADVFPLPTKRGKRSEFLEKAEQFATADVIDKLKAENTTDRFDQQVEWAEQLRSASFERYAGIEANISGTVMGGYQSVNEVVNWRRGANAEESIVIPGGQRNRELGRAWDKAVALVN